MNPLNALLPVFALIAVGYGLRRAGFPGPGFWSRVEQLTYYVLLPALLVRNLSTARFGELDPMPIVAAMALALLAMSVLVLALRPWLAVDGPGFSSVYQGAIRPNIYVALSGAAGLFGDAGVVLAAVVVAVMVPLGNVLSVFVLARYAHPSSGVSHALLAVLSNPMVLSCALGLLLNLTGAPLPAALQEILSALGSAALPLGLLAVGAGLQLAAVRHARGLVLSTTILKLLVFPAVTAGVCIALGLGPGAIAVSVLFAAVPGSGSAYVLAGQLGGDQRLLAAAITATVLGAMLTMPLVLWLLPG
jgi:hypothetical protein